MYPPNTVSFYLDKELQRIQTPASVTELCLIWYKYMFDFIPADTFTLASTTDLKNQRFSPDEARLMGNDSIKKLNNGTIVFKAPYAHRLYVGDNFNFKRDQHPLATARWGLVAAELYADAITNEYKEFLKRSKK